MTEDRALIKGERRDTGQWIQEAIICLLCVLLCGFFVRMTNPNSPLESNGHDAENCYYNLLVQGFSQGHLYVKRDAPAALARLANPYDPVANRPYITGVGDMSYFKGHLYLYFGVTPALVLYWPYHLLTGYYLSDGNAAAIFFAVGFAAALALMRAVCRRYFPEVNNWNLTASVLAVGLILGLTLGDSVNNVNQVAITSGFAFAMLALAGIWHVAHSNGKRRILWMFLTSSAYGLAVGSRPSLLFGVIVLLIPVAQAWREAVEPRERWRTGLLFLAAVGPVMLIGFGLMYYNDLRFGSPFEFGFRYALTAAFEPMTAIQFSPRYLWFNFWFYFLEPFGWTINFPFLQNVQLPPAPRGFYPGVRDTCGAIFTSYPLVLLAFAVPSAWMNRPPATASSLRWFVAAVFLLFAACTLTLCLFFNAAVRFELDFLPWLMLLAVIGFLGLWRVTSGLPNYRPFLFWGWSVLLGYSVAFSALSNIESHARADCFRGDAHFDNEHFDAATVEYKKAEALWPDCANAHLGLGNVLMKEQEMDAAIVEYQIALQIAPDYAQAHGNLGLAYLQTGSPDAAAGEYQKALELDPESIVFRCGLGDAFLAQGDTNQAMAQYQKAMEIRPQASEDCCRLAASLFRAGHEDDAIMQYQKAVQLDPTSADNHALLGTAYLVKGRFNEAITQYEKTVEIKPDYVQAYVCLGDAFLREGNSNRAIVEYQEAIQLQPDSAPAYNGLGDAFRAEGKATNAISSYKMAIEIDPQFTRAHVSLKKLEAEIKVH